MNLNYLKISLEVALTLNPQGFEKPEDLAQRTNHAKLSPSLLNLLSTKALFIWNLKINKLFY